MIDEEDVAGLIGLEPEQKFCIIEGIARRKLAESRLASGPNDYAEYDDFEYMVTVLAAAQEFGIDDLSGYEIPWRSEDGCDDRCRMFRAEATRISQRLLFRHGTQTKSVALDAATKEKISHWLKQMRKSVQQADVSVEKKDRLFGLIDQLQAEVDHERTPVQAVGELWVTICTYMGEGVKNLEPVARFVERVGGALGLAKQEEDALPKLPPLRDRQRLEPPQNAASKKDKNGFDKALDDEIPF